MRVRGVGPAPCSILICGEAPGWHESQCGRPFVGRTGDELDNHLAVNGLPDRRELFLTNIYREYRGKDYVYTAEDLRRDEPELLEELQRVMPSLIVPLGRHATRWFLGDVDMDSTWGIPWIDPNDESRIVLPVHHPASGFHNPEMAAYVVAGFKQLGAFLRGELEPRVLFNDPYPEPMYEEITNAQDLSRYVCGIQKGQALSIDTEGWPGRPWSLQFSYEPGRAYLVRATDRALLRQFGEFLCRVRPRLVFHSALHDLGMLRALHIDAGDTLAFDDTMVMAYLLQIEPQGLKALCARHCNMPMQSYDEILGDAGQRLAVEYLTWLWDGEQAAYEETCQAEFERRKTEVWTDAKGKVRSGRKITKVPQLPKTALHKAVERCLRSGNARRLWEDQVEDIRVAGYARLGPMPQATLDYVPRPTAVRYGCRDADGTTRLLPELSARIDSLGLRQVYELELGTYPLIDRMQRVGLKPDLEHFAALSDKLGSEIGRLRTDLVTATGDPVFNANSGDQVADYLFGTLKLEEVKWTRGGRGSTNDKILEGLEHQYPEYPVISAIREYREIYKLKHTFTDRLPDFVNRWPYDGRIHATFRTTRVVTGRLAASDPNLLAMPKHGKFAKDFRRGWVPEPGHVFGSWDLSQIELRIAAHLSQDPLMLAIYRGEKRNADGSLIDLHAALGERIFGIKAVDQDESKHRLPCKAVNFGYWMGQTATGLQVELAKNGIQLPLDDCQRWIDDADRLYIGARPYKRRMVDEARRNGFIRCLSGRIRYIGGIDSRDERVREEAERFAFSTPVQEGAQTVMKTAEVAIYRDILQPLWKEGCWIEPILQIHDDMFLEIEHEALARRVNPMMVQCMTQAYTKLSVPIKTSGDWGYNWCKFSKKDPHEGDMVPFDA